jgi:hypothetical protein
MRPVRLAFCVGRRQPSHAREEPPVSLVKIIVITLALLLSVLIFWRFLF